MRSKKLIVLILTMLIVISSSTAVFAEEIDYITNYQWNFPIPKSYWVERIIMNLDGDAVAFNKPQDMFMDKDEILYVADSGNNRIVKLDKTGHVLNIFTVPEEHTPLKDPQGVFVHPTGSIFIADTGNARIVHISAEGEFIEQFVKPESKLLDTTTYAFKPVKVAVDSLGYLNVLSENDFHGVIQIDGDNNFVGYLGMNKVTSNWIAKFVRFFATAEQKAQLSKIIPPYFTNIFLDEEGYYYTTTAMTNVDQIKKINVVGRNTFKAGKNYGQAFLPESRYTQHNTMFAAITVDKNKVVSVVDAAARRVYQYDQEGNNLCVFGGRGETRGQFEYPVAITNDSNGNLYVLDRDRNNIQVFRRTKFMELVHQAVELYYQGEYLKAVEPWEEALNINSTYFLAYSQIGKALYKQGRWKESMDSYFKAEDKEGYSNAFTEYRHDIYRSNFGWIVLIIAIAVFGLVKLLERSRAKANNIVLGGIKN